METCFASTASVLVGMALAGARPVGITAIGATVDRVLQSNAFARTASGHGVTVKVARQADLWITIDGSKWARVSSGTPSRLYDVTYGNGVFVSVGNEGRWLRRPTALLGPGGIPAPTKVCAASHLAMDYSSPWVTRAL